MSRSNNTAKKANASNRFDRERKIKRVGKPEYSKPKYGKASFITED